jgi:hypothetical protein
MDKKFKSKDQIYVSTKILGQLYDKVESVNFVPQYESLFDERITRAYEIDDATLKMARQLKSKYDTAMRRIMAQHEIKTEFEVWSTFILSKPRVGSDYKMQEEMMIVSDALKDRFRKLCIEAAGGKDPEQLHPFVAAMYRVTREEMRIALHECRETKIRGGKEEPKRKMEPKYMPLMSFPWLFHGTLGRIATGIERREDIENLGFSFMSTAREKTSRNNGYRDETDLNDVVETADGITHRDELLDLFRPDDIDSEGDEVEQPYQSRKEIIRNHPSDENDGKRNVVLKDTQKFLHQSHNSDRISSQFSSLSNGSSFSPSMSELAFLEAPNDAAHPKPLTEGINMHRDDLELISGSFRSGSNVSLLADLDKSPIGLRNEQEDKDIEEGEYQSVADQADEIEVLLDENDESPLERLARLTGC